MPAFPHHHRVYPRPYQAAPQLVEERPSYFAGLVHGMILGGVIVAVGIVYSLVHASAKASSVHDVAPAVERPLAEPQQPELPCEPVGESA